MCGVFGLAQPASAPLDQALLEAAHRVQAHRGPDGHGTRTYTAGNYAVALGHQRLSIIDLSTGGSQPMERHGGAGSLSYNGELYNYLELRDELASQGEVFQSRSDSEVLLCALHAWGPERALARFNWMGAFAWLDRAGGRLVLATDAGSEKPLYYVIDGPRLLFASEIKTLLTLAQRRFRLNRDTIGQYLFQGLNDATSETYFAGLSRVEAGTHLEFDLRADRLVPRRKPYMPPGFAGDGERMALPQFIEELRGMLADSVRLRLRSDVPVGVLLSGGIDSSSIAVLCRQLAGGGHVPQLLSAVSDDPRFDESPHIEAMERHLGQRASKITLNMAPDRLMEELADVIWYNDAPVGGLSALAHFKLMHRARQLGLTVILSGQGADESLLGYRKFLGFYVQSLLRARRPLRAAGVLGGFLLNGTLAAEFDFSDAKRYVPVLRRLSALRSGGSEASIEGDWVRGWRALDIGLGRGTLADRQFEDIRHYSVPSLCHYEDRMSMAHAREIRLPFLDSRLVDLLLRAPPDYKLRRGWTKYALREAMNPLLPASIAWRKDKKGFANPEGEWLKKELEPAVREAFAADSGIVRRGICDGRELLRKYEAYRAQSVRGGAIWYREIFAPLALEVWMRRYSEWIE
jgi:asparagine synthase (glutamine-hydrolysing)